MFSVQNVYSERFNPGAGDELGAGVPRRDISLHVASRDNGRNSHGRASVGRGGRGGRSDEEEAESHFDRDVVFTLGTACLLERGTLFSRYVILVVYQRGKIIRRSAGRCNCIFSRASHRAARISPSCPGLDSAWITGADFKARTSHYWTFLLLDIIPRATAAHFPPPFLQFVEELTSVRWYTVTGR